MPTRISAGAPFEASIGALSAGVAASLPMLLALDNHCVTARLVRA
jgi:hypothetical protein